MQPILTASTTCNMLLPVDINPANGSGANQLDFEYSRESCITQYFVNSSSTQKIPVTFDVATTSTTTISSSSQFYVDPVFTGGDMVTIYLLLLWSIGALMFMVVATVKNIQTKKTFLGYNGGDVEIRQDN